MNDILVLVATHNGYTSDRKLKALDMEEIKTDLYKDCKCGRGCMEQLGQDDLLFWRKKLHTKVQGFEQRSIKLDLYQTTKCDGAHKLHLINEHMICW